MAKKRRVKKPKVSPRVLEAQKKKEFRRKLLHIAKASGAEEVYKELPEEHVDNLYHIRFRAIRILPGHEEIPAQLLSEVKQFLNDYINACTVRVIEGGEEITYKDYISIARSLVYHLTGKQGVGFPQSIKDKFSQLIYAVEHVDVPEKIITEVAAVMGLYMSRLNRKFYWFEHKVEYDGQYLFDSLTLHVRQPDTIRISIRHLPRTIYRVGWAYPNIGMRWAKIKASALALKKPAPYKLRVYIQSHALMRLQERVGGVNISILQFHIHDALENPVFCSVGQQQMLEFRLYNKKIGYLTYSIRNNMMVIKTFLFLTMDGTPEGENLRQLFGLQAYDKKYLQIDKLEPFINSDIKDHPDLKEQFIQAGCEDLFAIGSENLQAKVALKNASTIKEYLKVPESLEELTV